MADRSKTVLLGVFLAGSLSAASLAGERKQWHGVTLTFEGPRTSETDTPNPFLYYRLNVTFTHGAKSYVVPGYFAADGNADTLHFEGKTISFHSEVTGVVNSKGIAGQDDLGQRVRIEGGSLIAYGTATALDEGAEVRFAAWQE